MTDLHTPLHDFVFGFFMLSASLLRPQCIDVLTMVVAPNRPNFMFCFPAP
jgi:hypothetical protein